jgi:urea ABC transporter urea binding protein
MKNKIKIGLLHSQTGTMSISEAPLLEAEQLAIAEINSGGGILGRQIEYIIEDGASSPEYFATKAKKMISEDNISFIFGGWNSHTRKAVRSVVEQYNALFWYPMQYEGLEQSDNIFYTGSCLNQQIIPAIEWCWKQGYRNYFLVGSDYIFPITANKLIHSILKQKKGKVIGEKYYDLGYCNFSDLVFDLKDKKPEIIINTLNGDSNIYFFKQLAEAGFVADIMPVLSTSIAERECEKIGKSTNGHFACWTYFQSLDNEENKAFVRKFREHYGPDAVVSDPIAMAYSQLFIWKQIIERIGSFDVDQIKISCFDQFFNTPAGRVEMKPNHHLTKKAFIGKSVRPGKFDIIWETGDYIEPLPWNGIEKMDFESFYLIKDIMAQFPDIINFNSELEKKVMERTQWLQAKKEEFETLYKEYRTQNIELVIAKEKAEESNMLKREFLNNMSHEIRTPLNGIMGFTEQLSKYNLTHEKREHYIKIIQNCSRQLLHIIDEILEISVLETKKVKKLEKEVCINNLLLNLFSIFDLKAKENKTPLFLNRSLSDEASTIKTDPVKLNKIVSNLLENAFKFTLQGYIEFGYSLITSDKGNTLQLYVKDTGIGIKPEMHEKIFERFAQEEKDLTLKVGGLGLGLSIAKENTELLGGEIKVESKKGEGSVFYINLPYKPVYPESRMQKDKISHTVLIVEDEEVNYLYLETLLGRYGPNIIILHAKNGMEAIEICNKNKNTDLILMDIKMPILNGYDATKRIKKAYPNIPIVAQTSYASKEDRKRAKKAGFDDYIEKPILENAFYQIVDKYIVPIGAGEKNPIGAGLV